MTRLLLISSRHVFHPRPFPDRAAVLPQRFGECDVEIGGVRFDLGECREVYFIARDGEHVSALAPKTGVGRRGVIDLPLVRLCGIVFVVVKGPGGVAGGGEYGVTGLFIANAFENRARCFAAFCQMGPDHSGRAEAGRRFGWFRFSRGLPAIQAMYRRPKKDW